MLSQRFCCFRSNRSRPSRKCFRPTPRPCPKSEGRSFSFDVSATCHESVWPKDMLKLKHELQPSEHSTNALRAHRLSKGNSHAFAKSKGSEWVAEGRRFW